MGGVPDIIAGDTPLVFPDNLARRSAGALGVFTAKPAADSTAGFPDFADGREVGSALRDFIRISAHRPG